MILENIATTQLIENLGWTLLHSIWQIVLIAFWLFLALRIFAKSPTNLRYLISLFALVLTLILSAATFVRLSQNSAVIKPDIISYDAKNPVIFRERIEVSEEFSPLNNTKNASFNKANFFVSVESLQSDFTKNFAAASPILVALWLLGMIIFALRLTGGIWQTRVYKTRETSNPSEDWQRKFVDLVERLKINRTIRLLQSKIVETPMVVGWLKPVILIPTSVFLCMNSEEIETIIVHELEHIRRRDYPVNFAQNFIEILFFYHPLAWWISAQIRRERECACDDAVLRILENSNIVYANALANLEEFRQSAKQTASPILVAANGGKLMKRIERIINKNKNAKTGKFQNSLWSASLVCGLILALMLGIFSATEQSFVNAQSKSSDVKGRKMAVGFVSIPPNFNEKTDRSFDETARLLVDKLTAHRVPAIGFINGLSFMENGKLSKSRLDVARMWHDAGLEIGIGTFKHVWFYDTPYEEYINRTLMNEGIAKLILVEKNTPLRYFSYPFLNTGKTIEDKNKFENWLASRNLRSVKYTFDNSEWMYSFAYDKAREDNDTNMMKEIRADYLAYMTKMTDHYEAYSQDLFGRDIAQTLVLTPSRLVADTADEFFGILEQRGYQFVSMDDAQVDEAYRTPDNFSGKAGISWFERWQMAQGKKLRTEPKVSQSIADDRDNRKDKNGPLPPKPPAPPTTSPPNKMP